MGVNKQPRIGVIGGNSCPSEITQMAGAVGVEIARRGAILICGGLTGVMEAACRGAKSAGGTTIGVLPGFDATEANDYVDIPIVTGMSYARNLIIVCSCWEISPEILKARDPKEAVELASRTINSQRRKDA